jgi:glycosyltransferase involved in cell wall biosynthesis
MKILFLIFHGFSEFSGITKKIHYQVDGLKEAGHKVDLCYYTVASNNHRLRMINDEVLEDYGRWILAPIKKRICFEEISRYIQKNHIELIYMRSDHNANPFTIHFVKTQKKHGIKTIMEIPTFPYDQEYKGFPLQSQIELWTDKFFRKYLAKQLFRISTFSDCDFIFGAKTIKISNGIDFSQIKQKTDQSDSSSSFHLIGVAEVHYWHGFDRVIKGIGEYYQHPNEKEVFFHIVGGVGPSEMSVFKPIIQKYNIEKYIIFHGTQFGEELNSIFEQANFGIGSLARHRSQIRHIKTLKNREYAARGIPFIYSEIDSDFEDKPYILKATADESSIDIYKIISFYDQCTCTPLEIRNSIKDLSWKIQMQKVVDEVLKNK